MRSKISRDNTEAIMAFSVLKLVAKLQAVGLRPELCWGSLQRSPDPVAGRWGVHCLFPRTFSRLVSPPTVL